MKPILISAALSALLFTGCGDDTPNTKELIVPAAMQETYDAFQYAPAMRAGDFVFLSGVVVTVTPEDGGDIRPAIARAFDEIDLILSEAGTDWANVVDVTSYMTDLDNQIGPLWEVKGERVPAPYPAWTAIGVSRLYGGDAAIIEIKVTAYVPEDD